MKKKMKKCRSSRALFSSNVRTPAEVSCLQGTRSFARSSQAFWTTEFPEPVSEHWTTLKHVINSSCEAALGLKRKTHQDWFDENDAALQSHVHDKQRAFVAYQNDSSPWQRRLATGNASPHFKGKHCCSKDVGIRRLYIPGSSPHPYTRNILSNSEAKRAEFDSSHFADDATIIGRSEEIAMGKEIIEEVMGNFEEQTNKSKEEHVIFGDLESGNVRMLGTWLGHEKDTK